jgi:hypothetical protein
MAWPMVWPKLRMARRPVFRFVLAHDVGLDFAATRDHFRQNLPSRRSSRGKSRSKRAKSAAS